MLIDRLAVKPSARSAGWPFDIPAVRQIADEGLSLRAPVTVFVGPNGSGKSTVIEAIAEAYGIDVRGGHGGRRYGSHLEKSTLGASLELRCGGFPVTARRSRSTGFLLRAETATEMLERMTHFGVSGYGDRFSDEVSHGESYLQVMQGRFTSPGLYLLDEAEGPLSFESSLVLLRTLHDLARHPRSQVIYASHSPLVAGIPDADILEFGPDGIAGCAWPDLRAGHLWRAFLANPARFFG